MAWTAPATWTTGQVVTAAELNEQIKDNETYLKGQTDRLDNVAQSVVTGSRAFNTSYQNTSGKAMLVTVSGSVATGAGNNIFISASTDDNATPSTVVCSSRAFADAVGYGTATITFVVLAGNYYRVVYSSVGAAVVNRWTEWTL